MKSETLDIFWVEKIRLTQFLFQITGNLTNAQLNFTCPEGGWDIRKNLLHLAQTESGLKFTIPFSVKISSFFPFSKTQPADIEKELVRNREVYNFAPLPANLRQLICRKAKELEVDYSNKDVSNLFSIWKNSLIYTENYLDQFSEDGILRKRFIYRLGIYSFPAGINRTVVHLQHHLKVGIERCLNHPMFPK